MKQSAAWHSKNNTFQLCIRYSGSGRIFPDDGCSGYLTRQEVESMLGESPEWAQVEVFDRVMYDSDVKDPSTIPRKLRKDLIERVVKERAAHSDGTFYIRRRERNEGTYTREDDFDHRAGYTLCIPYEKRLTYFEKKRDGEHDDNSVKVSYSAITCMGVSPYAAADFLQGKNCDDGICPVKEYYAYGSKLVREGTKIWKAGDQADEDKAFIAVTRRW